MLQKTMNYAVKCHSDTNHLYDGKSYSHHLSMVVGIANDFIHLVPEKERENVLMACWCHDLIEDCRETYNDVKKATNGKVADIVYAVTNEKGRTRSDRANHKYYEGIKNVPHADFVKICDRIANYEYSKNSGSSMYEKYTKEMEHFFISIGYDLRLKEMWKRLNISDLD